MRTRALQTSLVLAAVSAAGCTESAKPQAPPVAQGRSEPASPESAKPSQASPSTPSPPPAPEGAVTLVEPTLFVQTCAEPHPCPALVQVEGEKHCAALTLGAAEGWRLPTRDEVERMRGRDGLAELAGYHWTSSAFEEDDAQVWIVDPSSDQPTTIPRDRKPFRVRCVREP